MTDSAVILAVPLPHMEQILVDARSIRTTSLLTLLGMHRMLWCLWTGEILPSSLPAHQEPFNHYLHLGHFKDADEPHGNYYCSFQVLKYISFQWLSATHVITELINSKPYQCGAPAQKCFSECAKPPYYRISVFNSVICDRVYVNCTKCTNLFTTVSLPSEVIVSTCLIGDDDLRSPTFGLKNRLYYL